MKTITVKTSKIYDVVIGNNILYNVGKLLAEKKEPCEVMVVTDNNVQPLYLDRVVVSLSEVGYTVSTFVIENGERSKSLNVAGELLESCAENCITRNGLIVALGGGVIGDLSGFVASIYLRGIDFIQIPTTILSAVDSSVGGKTAVNLASGKNLAGAFHQPFAVFCDVDTFNTLPKEVYNDGMGEVIKYGAIKDASILDRLVVDDIDIIDIIATCVDIKRVVVENDEFDTGERMILNYGHTIGHTIEILSNYEVSHGYAVGIGMYMMAVIGEKLNETTSGTSEIIKRALKRFDIPYEYPYSKQMSELALHDKKRNSQHITLVMLDKIGSCFLKKVPVDDLENIFSLGV